MTDHQSHSTPPRGAPPAADPADHSPSSIIALLQDPHGTFSAFRSQSSTCRGEYGVEIVPCTAEDDNDDEQVGPGNTDGDPNNKNGGNSSGGVANNSSSNRSSNKNRDRSDWDTTKRALSPTPGRKARDFFIPITSACQVTTSTALTKLHTVREDYCNVEDSVQHIVTAMSANSPSVASSSYSVSSRETDSRSEYTGRTGRTTEEDAEADGESQSWSYDGSSREQREGDNNSALMKSGGDPRGRHGRGRSASAGQRRGKYRNRRGGGRHGGSSSATSSEIAEQRQAVQRPPIATSEPTPAEWADAYSQDKELHLVSILIQNPTARASYEQNTSAFRLALHDELMSNQLTVDPDDSMVYFVGGSSSSETAAPTTSASAANSSSSSNSNENPNADADDDVCGRSTPLQAGGKRSSPLRHSNSGSNHSESGGRTTDTKRLRIVPQNLRHRIFDVALQNSSGNGNGNGYGGTSSGGVGALTLFHRIRQRYYWPNMYSDINGWWGTSYGQQHIVVTSRPSADDDEMDHHRVFPKDPEGDQDKNKNDDVNVTQETVDITQDSSFDVPSSSPTAAAVYNQFEPASVAAATSSANANASTDDDNGQAAAAAAKTDNKKKGKISGLRNALTRMSPKRMTSSGKKKKKEQQLKDKAEVDASVNASSDALSANTAAAPSDDASAAAALVSGGGTAAKSPPCTPDHATAPADAPAIVRKNSFASLFRANSKSSSAGADAEKPLRSRSNTPPNNNSNNAGGTSSPSTSAQSTPSRKGFLPHPMKKTDSFGRMKKTFSNSRIGKKLAGGSSGGGSSSGENDCTVTHVVRYPSDAEVRVKEGQDVKISVSKNSLREAKAVLKTDAKPDATKRVTAAKEKKSDDNAAKCMSVVSDELGMLMNILADEVCHGGDYGTDDDNYDDDDGEEDEHWQRALPIKDA